MTTFPHLASPWALLLLTLLPLLVWLHHRRPVADAMTYSRLPADARGGWRLHLPFYCRLLALGLVALALSRPQLGYAWEESLTEGIDIQIVLDISGSMGAEDFKPENRLSVAKSVVQEFIDGRPADRIGLVVFSGAALTRAPLTTDRRMLKLLVSSVELHTLPDGTAIGVALASAAARLKAGQAKSRIIVLVTDGVNNAGEIDPLSAAAICQGLGIKVYTVGVGTAGRVPVPIPVQNRITGRRQIRRVHMNVEVDEELLRTIAERTDGRFFKASDPQTLRHIFATIDELERTPLRVKRYVRYEEAFQPLAWAALGLVLLPIVAQGVRLTAQP